MTDKTKQAMGKAKAAAKDKAAKLRLHYLEMLRQAKQYQVPKLRAGDTNSQLEQIGTLLNVDLPTVGTTQLHVQRWFELMVEDGMTELTECTPLEAAVCILLCWRAQQQKPNKEQVEAMRLARGDDYNDIRRDREAAKAAAEREKRKENTE